VFLDASPEERAARRHRDLPGSRYEDVLAALKARDAQDSSREAAPLARARDAVVVDTTGLSIDDVVAQILGFARARGA
jgi:CMP/dCMP kinase